MKKNKILFFSKESVGGVGSFLKQISKIDEKKIIKRFYLYKKDSLSPIKTKSRLINKDYPNNLVPSFQKIIHFLKNIFLTYRILSKEKPDLIFTCDHYSSIIVLIIKKLFMARLKIICQINTNIIKEIEQKPNKVYRILLINLMKGLYPTADKIVFTSNQLSKNLTKSFNLEKAKTLAIYYGIDIKKLNKTVNEECNQDTKKIKKDKILKIVSIGRLVPQKDFFTVIKAFSLVIKEYKNISLFIIGDGELKKELNTLIKQLKLDKNIHFLGWKKNIYTYLKIMDIFVFSSHYEGFGMVIIEAMACGLPIIATNSPYGPAEILDNGKYGILIPVNNEKMMAKEMERLLKNKKLRDKYGDLARQRAKKFNYHKMIKNYEKLFIDLINEKN